MIHKTRALMLRSVRYGETSLVVTLFTEKFGLQSYMVKGVRKSAAQGQMRAGHFQPGQMLDLVVTHSDRGGLQYIRESHLSLLLSEIGRDIRKQSVSIFMMELLLKCLRQPEVNAELFSFMESSLLQLESGSDRRTANFPVFFSLRLARLIGFHLDDGYREDRQCLDLREGIFLPEPPLHMDWSDGDMAALISRFIQCLDAEDTEAISLNRDTRRKLLGVCVQFLSLHVSDFGTMRSLPVLQEVLD